MSDEKKAPSVEELLTNFKAEMNRKLENVTSQSKNANDTLIALANSVQARQVEQQQTAYKKQMDTLAAEDPSRFQEETAKRAADAARQATEEAMVRAQTVSAQAQAKQAQVIGEITSNYPEINLPNHPMQKKVLELYNALPEEERNSSVAYKLIAKEAAEELGIKPMSKRTEDEMDEFVGYGRGSRGQGAGRKRAGIDPKTLQFAELMGINVKDEKVRKELEDYSQISGSDWLKYKDSRKGGQ